jgi:ankyrin repeat protein
MDFLLNKKQKGGDEDEIDFENLIKNLSISELKELFEKGILDTEDLNEDGENILHLACLFGNFDLVRIPPFFLK